MKSFKSITTIGWHAQIKNFIKMKSGEIASGIRTKTQASYIQSNHEKGQQEDHLYHHQRNVAAVIITRRTKTFNYLKYRKNHTTPVNFPWSKAPLWLLKAHTKNAHVVIKNDCTIWMNGMWESGTWLSGTWKNGTWENGVWESGMWLNGIWKSGTWKNGTWLSGTWESGMWVNGIWMYGTWKNGTWENGTALASICFVNFKGDRNE